MIAALRGGVSVEGCALAGGRGWVALPVSHRVYSGKSVEQFAAFRLIWGPRAFLADAADSRTKQTNG